MSRRMKLFVVPLVLLVLFPIVALAIQSALARRPAHLGAKDGRLAPCPPTPNVVSTRAELQEHQIEPLTFTGDPADAWRRLKLALQSLPRTQVITDEEGYLHAESTSALFRFVDDVEFLLDKSAGQIHFRSASRVGHSDLGVNRARMEAIRKAFNAQPPSGT